MISKPPPSGNLELDKWLQNVRYAVNNSLKSLIVGVSPLGTGSAALHGKHSARTLAVGQTAYFEPIIPETVSRFQEAGIRIIPTLTGTIDYTVNFSYAPIGSDQNISTKTLSVTGLAVTDDEITEIDIPVSTFFTDLDTRDQLGIEIVLDAATTTTDIRVMSLFIKYI